MKDEPRLTGMPGPSQEIIHRTEAVKNAVRDLHSAFLGVLDHLRSQDKANITMVYTIRGDRIQITITPKREE